MPQTISPAHLSAYLAACERALAAKVAYHATPIGDPGEGAALEDLTVARQIVEAIEDGIAFLPTDPAGYLVDRADDADRRADASPPRDEREAATVRELTAAKRVAARLLRAADDLAAAEDDGPDAPTEEAHREHQEHLSELRAEAGLPIAGMLAEGDA